MFSVRRPHDRLFQIRGPAAPKLLCVRGTANMLSEEDRRDRRLRRRDGHHQPGTYRHWPHNVWRTRQASLNSTRRRTCRKPVQLTQHRRNVITMSGYGDETCCGILQRLDSPHDVLSHSTQKRIAVVQTARYERLNQCLGSFRSEWPDEWT